MEFNVHNLVKWFQLNYPKLVKSMQKSNHHYSDDEINPYHIEGDVWTHTMMVVLESTRNGTGDKNFDTHLLICALLHDIGKPMARSLNEEKKRVHFFGHEPLSAFLCVSILDKIEQDFNIQLNKRLIFEAISMHTDVFKVPEDKLIKRLVNNRTLAKLLSRLSLSDHNGRFYEMGDRVTYDMIPPIDIDKEIKTGDREVICMVGLPCSGKSTVIQNGMLEGQQILSRDNIVMELGKEQGIESYNEAFHKVDQKEVDKRFNKRRAELVKSGKTIWLDMTNMGRKARKKNLHGFKDYKKSAYVVIASLEDITFRNKNREGKVIPDKVYERMISSFQPPLYDEFDEIHWEFN